MLGEVDLTTLDAAEVGLANAFWLRWMQLRKEARLKQLIWDCLSAACAPLLAVIKSYWQASSWTLVMLALPGMASLAAQLVTAAVLFPCM